MAKTHKKSHIACILLLVMCMIGGGSMLSFASSESADYESYLTVDQVYQLIGVGPAELECKYSLSSSNQDNPLPDGSSGGTYSFTLNSTTDQAGEIKFTTAVSSESSSTQPTLTFTHAGVYSYTLKPDPDTVAALEAEGYKIDTTEYNVTVYVENFEGGLVVQAVLAYDATKDPEDPETEKLSAIHYYDSYSGGYNPCWIDPPVKKIITGDTPKHDVKFYFTLTAKPGKSELPEGMDKMPMPEAAGGSQSYTMTITGEGEKEFGVIEYTQPGKYVYEITEKKGSAKGYGYDKKVYKLIANVTSDANKNLHVETTYTYNKVLEADKAVFKNAYSKSNPHPKTGDEIHMMLLIGLMAAAALTIILIFVLRRRRNQED